MERRVERALGDLQRVARDLANPLGDGPAVQRPERERLEDQEIERALREVEMSQPSASPVYFYRTIGFVL